MNTREGAAVQRGPRLVLPVVFVASAAAIVATPDVPWASGALLVGLGAVGLLWAPATALALAVAWCAAVAGPAGAAVLGGAIVVGASRWSRVSTAGVLVTLLIAAKQALAARVLPGAWDVVPEWVTVGVVTSCAAAVGVAGWGGGASAPPWRFGGGCMLFAGGAVLLRVATLPAGAAGLAEAGRAGGVRWVYDEVLSAVPRDGPGRTRALAELVRADAQRDDAAVQLPAELALNLGWRPQRVGGDAVVAVAEALDARGRGGEALRLLGRHPREGAVDWTMALLEAAQGDPVRWRGAVDPSAPTLPGRVEWPAELLADGDVSRVLRVAARVTTLTWEGTGDAFEGAPSAEVRVDGRAVGRWALDGDGRVPVDLAPGPHRVTLRFDTDRVGPGGDRNIHLEGLTGD